MEQQLGMKIAGWPLNKWDFPQLTLAAWYYDPRLQSAQRDWQVLEAEVSAAYGEADGARPDVDRLSLERLPVPFASSAQHTGPPRSGPTARPPTHLAYENPVTWRKEGVRGVARAQHLARSARLRLQGIAWDIQAGVRSNVLTYVALERGKVMLEELESTLVNLVDVAALQPASGTAADLDLPILRLQLAQIRLVLIRASLDFMSARERLAASLTLPVDSLLQVEVGYDFCRGVNGLWTVPDLRDQALHDRADIAGALTDYASAEGAVRLAFSKVRPQLTLPAACRWQSEANRWTVAQAQWLPSGPRSNRTVSRAEWHRLAVAANLLQLQGDIIDRVERRAAVYRATEQAAARIEALVESIDRHHTVAQQRFKVGIAEASEVLVARAQLIAARIAGLEAGVAVQSALGSLEDAVQLPAELLGKPSLQEALPDQTRLAEH